MSDFEKLREHLGITKWQVFGGSWGSTLALAYAQKHPERTTELVLRGIFLLRKKEIDWFYQSGASIIFPDAWDPYLAHIPAAERGDMLGAYYRRLTSEDPEVRVAASKVGSVWEGATSKLLPDPGDKARHEEDTFALAFARIEAHYFFHRGFFETDDQLLRDVGRIRGIPAVIVQGRSTSCARWTARGPCTARGQRPTSSSRPTPDSMWEPANSRALVAATDRFASR